MFVWLRTFCILLQEKTSNKVMNGEFLMSKTVGRSKSKKNNKITTKLGMVLVVSCLILLAVVVLYKAQKESLQVQAAELQEQLDSAKEDYKKLEEREKYMQTDEYVEDVARSQLGLIYPDEIVVKPEE